MRKRFQLVMDKRRKDKKKRKGKRYNITNFYSCQMPMLSRFPAVSLLSLSCKVIMLPLCYWADTLKVPDQLLWYISIIWCKNFRREATSTDYFAQLFVRPSVFAFRLLATVSSLSNCFLTWIQNRRWGRLKLKEFLENESQF